MLGDFLPKKKFLGDLRLALRPSKVDITHYGSLKCISAPLTVFKGSFPHMSEIVF